LRDPDVLDGGIDIRLRTRVGSEHAGYDFFSGESGEGEWTNELLRGRGHDHLNANAAVLKKADHLGSFVSRNST
jgi:hypothetical protein